MVALAERAGIPAINSGSVGLPVVQELAVPPEGFLVEDQLPAEGFGGSRRALQVSKFNVYVSYVRNIATLSFPLPVVCYP